MNTIHRLCNPLISKSFFIFGPRGTGKTTLLKALLTDKDPLWIDLLLLDTEERFATDLSLLSKMIKSKPDCKWVVIDEIQKIPELLNMVHHHIESDSVHFALTGSSARKLKKENVNLLAGRAFFNNLHPFTHLELGQQFNLDEALNYGTLPSVFSLTTALEKKEYLRSYALGYLKGEVWSEHLIKDLSTFRAFLPIAAQTNGKIINFSNIAKDVDVDPSTIKNYFQILIDTLIGFYIEPYHKSVRKRQRHNPKFYLFDPGVQRALSKTLEVLIIPGTYEYGNLFEQFVILEIMRLNDYYRRDFSFYYLRTENDVEIDLIIERPGIAPLLVEIKSNTKVDDRHTSTLESFLQGFNQAQAYLLSKDPFEQKIGHVSCFPWEAGIKKIFSETI